MKQRRMRPGSGRAQDDSGILEAEEERGPQCCTQGKVKEDEVPSELLTWVGVFQNTFPGTPRAAAQEGAVRGPSTPLSTRATPFSREVLVLTPTSLLIAHQMLLISPTRCFLSHSPSIPAHGSGSATLTVP